jgi:hypothetical protein
MEGYKKIKKVVSDLDCWHQNILKGIFLVSSFDADFKIGSIERDKKKLISFVKKTFSGIKSRNIFTYSQYIYWGKPRGLQNIKVITYTPEQYEEIISEASNNVKVLNNCEYEKVDRRCNLDLSLDLLKIWGQTEDLTVCWYEPQRINKTFFFFSTIIVLRTKESVYDNEKFPIDKFAPFFQRKTEINSGNSLIQIFRKGV